MCPRESSRKKTTGGSGSHDNPPLTHKTHNQHLIRLFFNEENSQNRLGGIYDPLNRNSPEQNARNDIYFPHPGVMPAGGVLGC